MLPRATVRPGHGSVAAAARRQTRNPVTTAVACAGTPTDAAARVTSGIVTSFRFGHESSPFKIQKLFKLSFSACIMILNVFFPEPTAAGRRPVGRRRRATRSREDGDGKSTLGDGRRQLAEAIGSVETETNSESGD